MVAFNPNTATLWYPSSLMEKQGDKLILDPIRTQDAIKRVLDILYSNSNSISGTPNQIITNITNNNVVIAIPPILDVLTGFTIGMAAPLHHFLKGNGTNYVDGTILVGDLPGSGAITVTAGTGMSGGGAVSLGGTVTLTNAGVTSAVGTTNQVSVSAATGPVTFSLPQSIATTSTPQFAKIGLNAAAHATALLYLNGSSAYAQISDTGTNATAWRAHTNSDTQQMIVGQERAAGGALLVGSAAYAAVFGSVGNSPTQFATNNTVRATFDTSGNFGLLLKINQYNSVNTTGWGVPAVYANGRATAQTGANASVSTYTCGAADGSFIVSANILMTAFTAGTVTTAVTYKDEGGTSRTAVFNFASITGTLGTTVGAAGAFEGLPLHIRVQANAVITIATTVSIFTGTYNVEGYITQIG